MICFTYKKVHPADVTERGRGGWGYVGCHKGGRGWGFEGKVRLRYSGIVVVDEVL